MEVLSVRKRIIVVCIVVIAVISSFIINSNIGTKPFKNLEANEIRSATVRLLPPDTSISLDHQEIISLVKILNEVVIYKKDNSYTEYDGQAVIYTIPKIDGSEVVICAYNPFLIINGIGYQTKYIPCEKLNVLGNSIDKN